MKTELKNDVAQLTDDEIDTVGGGSFGAFHVLIDMILHGIQ